MWFTQAQPSRRQPHYWATSEAAHDNDDLHELCREALSRQARRFHSAKSVLGKVGTHSSLFFIFPYKIMVNSMDWTISSLFDQSYPQVGRNGALKLISDEMSNKYFWQNMTFPRMMEEKGFPENKADGLKQYHYR